MQLREEVIRLTAPPIPWPRRIMDVAPSGGP